MTVFAWTWPVTWAPCSIVTLPSTLTSPLKRPAIRTWPAPSILPSIVTSAAISDSLALALAAAARSRFGVGSAAWALAGALRSTARTMGSGTAGVLASPAVAAESF